jgi:hypothetical protein
MEFAPIRGRPVQAGALDRFPIRLNRKALQLFNFPRFLRKTGATPDAQTISWSGMAMRRKVIPR